MTGQPATGTAGRRPGNDWRHQLETCFLPMSCATPRHRGQFAGALRNHRMADIVVSEVTSDPHRITRTEDHIASRNDGSYYLNLQLAGSVVVRQHGSEALVGPGELAIIDTNRPYEIESAQHFDLLCFNISKHSLPGALRRNAESAELSLGANPDLVPVIRSFVKVMRANPGGGIGIDTRLSGALLQTLSLAVDADGAYRNVSLSASQELLLQSMRGFVLENLSTPDFRAGDVAARFGISERYVRKIFSAAGESFRDFLRNQRLERCRGVLRAEPAVNIAELAFSAGFNDLSTFYRAFRAKFGCTPRDLAR